MSINNETTAVANRDLDLLLNTSLVDVVAEKIRTNIYTGKYKAGQKLIVRELSDEFGVSHTPVKDALNRLIAEGYVEALPHRSVVVRTYSNSELIDSLQARMMCELFFAEEIIAGAKAHPEVHEEMLSTLEKMRQLISDPENMLFEEWVAAEQQFHFSYMQHCGNSKVFKFYQELDTNKTTYFTYLNTNNASLPLHTLESNIVEHQAITDAIGALNSQKFISAISWHITRACEDYAVDEECQRKAEKLNKSLKRYDVYHTIG